MFHIFRVLKSFIHKRDMLRFCVEKFLFLGTENFLSGTLLCFRNFLVWKKIRDQKVGVSFYRRKIFVPNRKKHRGRTLLCFRNVLESKIFWIIAVSRFCRSSLSHSTEKFHRRTLVFQNFSGIKIFWIIRVSRFCRLFLSHRGETFVEKSSIIQINWCIHKL